MAPWKASSNACKLLLVVVVVVKVVLVELVKEVRVRVVVCDVRGRVVVAGMVVTTWLCQSRMCSNISNITLCKSLLNWMDCNRVRQQLFNVRHRALDSATLPYRQ